MTSPRLLCCALFATCPVFAAEDPIPTPLPADRYAAMSEKSPFALATAAAPIAQAQASFAANWFVSGIGRLGDTDFVTIKSRDSTTQFSLFGQEPQNGVSVASVNWSDTIGKSTVVLQKGTETAKLEFNEAELRGPAQATPAPNAKGTAVSAGGTLTINNANGTTMTISNPRSAPLPGGAPHPGGGNMVPPPVVTPNRSTQQFPPNVPKPGEIRRRDRPIPVPK